MKSILIYILIIIGLISCTENFEEINSNPNNPTKVEPDFLFTTSQFETLNLYGGEMNRIIFFNYTHHFAGFQGEFQRYTYSVGSNNNYWEDTYVRCLQPVNQIIELFENDPIYTNRVVIAKIWRAYIFSNAVSMWGPIPKSDALTGSPSVAFDKEDEIYYSLLEELKNLTDAFDMDADTYDASADKIYEGDLLKWKKFAITLRLRIAMRISNADPTTAERVVGEIQQTSDGVISSKSETASMNWGTTSDTWSHLYDRVVYNYTANKATIPVINESLIYHMLPYNDPRISVYAQPAKQGPFEGQYFGQNISYGGGQEYTTRQNPHEGLKQDDYSYIGERFLKPDAEYIFLSYAEASFLKAEAALKGWWTEDNAESYYYEGIDASFKHYDLPESDADSYKSTPGIEWGTPSDTIGHQEEFQDWMGIADSYIGTNDFYRQIVMQHWLAIIGQGIDSWAFLRRTQVLEFEPQFATYDGAYKYMPGRLPYPESEYATNPDEVLQAVQWLDGPDGLFTKLWFALPNKENPNLP